MKRVLSFLPVLLILISLSIPSSADASPLISVSNVNASPGDEVSVTVSMSNNPGIVGLTLGFDYDQNAMTLVSIQQSGLTGMWQKAVKVAWASSSGDQSYNGVFLTLKFKISDSAGSGEYPVGIVFAPGDICNDALEDVPFSVEPGFVSVSAPESTQKPAESSAPVSADSSSAADTVSENGDISDTVDSGSEQSEAVSKSEEVSESKESSDTASKSDDTAAEGAVDPESSAAQSHTGLYVFIAAIVISILSVAALFLKKKN